jgi:hypothetical protein
MHTFSYTINPDYVTLKTQSIAARQTTVGYQILNNEIHLTG